MASVVSKIFAAFALPLVDAATHNHSREHDLTDDRDAADGAADREVLAHDAQTGDGACDREREHAEDHERRAEPPEVRVENAGDGHERERKRDGEPAHRALLDQMRHYPLVDHDDGLDCLEMLWKISQGGGASAGVSVGGGTSGRRVAVPARRVLFRRLK